MRELYELTTLAFPLLSASQVAMAARDRVSMPDAVGALLGCWRTEIGPLGRMLILRRFDDADALQRERHRALMSANPFNAGAVVTALEMDSYRPFPFLPPALAAAHDAVCEFRTYQAQAGRPAADARRLGSRDRAGRGLYGAPDDQHVCSRRAAADHPDLGIR